MRITSPEDSEGELEDPDDALTAEERAAIHTGIQNGLRDFAEGRFGPFAEVATEVSAGIQRGSAAVQAGRTRPARDFFAEMEAKYRLPSQ